MANYIDNIRLLKEITPYAQACRVAKENNTIMPRIPEYVGGDIKKIAEHIATKGNFANYSWIEEMIEDGIENCILYLHNFDERTSNNPF